ncbi:MAG: hypothetical protein ACJ72W_00195 [Actinoallomurus sp.]
MEDQLSGVTWHPRLREFERKHPDADEDKWPENAACREELVAVQQRVRVYALAFARLAGVQNAETMLSSDP